MNVLDLFSGIGGFSLGLERAGMRTVAFCEIDPFCRRVLAKHWPAVPVYGDVRELTGARLVADADAQRRGWWTDNEGSPPAERDRHPAAGIDLICGGFPCQPVSVAGKRAGHSDERWLWPEFFRLIGEVKPRWVVVENVPGLLSANSGRLFGGILRDLASVGMSVEWHSIPASAVGAPHRRDRIWIVAYANGPRLEGWLGTSLSECLGQCAAWPRDPSTHNGNGEPQSYVGRVAHGVPARVDRLRALGNAVVPQVVEIIGRAIMEIENGSQSLHKNAIDLARWQESQGASLDHGAKARSETIIK
jgi:DNA (cytosine-5)-methyltransferase 1